MSSNDSARPTYTSSEAPSPSPNVQSTLAFIQALNEQDISKLSAVLDESLAYHILPRSFGRPVRNKTVFLANFEQNVFPLFKRLHVTIHELFEAGSVVTFHASSIGESAFGTPYANEYVFILHFVPAKDGGDGLPKISVVKEFIDSALANKFFPEEYAKLEACRAATTADESA